MGEISDIAGISFAPPPTRVKIDGSQARVDIPPGIMDILQRVDHIPAIQERISLWYALEDTYSIDLTHFPLYVLLISCYM